MRQDAVIAVRLVKKAGDPEQTLDRLLATDPAALDRDHDGHHAEPGAAGRDHFGAVAERLIAALAGEAAGRVREVPEVPEGPALDQVEQSLVVEIGRPIRPPAGT